jgi:CheY-like chemotaxis protein
MGSKILVVDDDRDTREMVSVLLTDAAYEAITAGTLHAAIDALTDNQPDLLITDVRLHGYNGLQLIATAPTPIPAIVVTGHSDRMIEAEARRLGAEYLLKPVAPLRLLLAVREKLGGIPCTSRQAAPRRWDRKPISPTIAAEAGGVPLHIIDVSHGGLRFEIDRIPGQFLPLSFQLAMPDRDLEIGIDVIWKERQDGLRWICGAAVSDNRPRWRALVDSLS